MRLAAVQLLCAIWYGEEISLSSAMRQDTHPCATQTHKSTDTHVQRPYQMMSDETNPEH